MIQICNLILQELSIPYQQILDEEQDQKLFAPVEYLYEFLCFPFSLGIFISVPGKVLNPAYYFH